MRRSALALARYSDHLRAPCGITNTLSGAPFIQHNKSHCSPQCVQRQYQMHGEQCTSSPPPLDTGAGALNQATKARAGPFHTRPHEKGRGERGKSDFQASERPHKRLRSSAAAGRNPTTLAHGKSPRLAFVWDATEPTWTEEGRAAGTRKQRRSARSPRRPLETGPGLIKSGSAVCSVCVCQTVVLSPGQGAESGPQVFGLRPSPLTISELYR